MYLQNNLLYLRKSQNLSFRKLGIISGVSHTVIERIEKGKALDPTITTIDKLSKALNVSIDDLVSEDLSQNHLLKELNKSNESIDEYVWHLKR